MTYPKPSLPNDHWVTRGYQKHFADEKQLRVSVLQAGTGKIIANGRPIRRNFAMPGFTTYFDQDGTNKQLEDAFMRVEGPVLNAIRKISVDNCGPRMKAAVANLFAVHLVRNPTFKVMHALIMEGFRTEDVPQVAANPRLPAMFQEAFGRLPREGELHEIALEQFTKLFENPGASAHTMMRQHDEIAARLNQFHMQLIFIDDDLPGFVLGDVPIVHAHTGSDRYGFRDHLALLDANLIIGPLSRRVAACFTFRPFPPARVVSRVGLDPLNAVFIRAAARELACHPDDASYIQDVFERVDSLPIEHMLGRETTSS
jgi:hypothetical protein